VTKLPSRTAQGHGCLMQMVGDIRKKVKWESYQK